MENSNEDRNHAVSEICNGRTDCVMELEAARRREQELIQQKSDSEAAFGQQRAKFIELFRQKEDELCRTRQQKSDSEKTIADLQCRMSLLMAELDDVKTAAAVAESVRLDEIEHERQKCAEEVATLQQLMKEEHSQSTREHDRLRAEIAELQSRLSQDRESFLGSVTKSLQKRIGQTGLMSPGADRTDTEDSNEFDIRKAQEDAEMLRSVIGPLEDEIDSLRSQLRHAQQQQKTDETTPLSDCKSRSEVESQVKELQDTLRREKSSRTDLEMYVAVLHTQKHVLHDDAEKLRMQLNDVCRMLEDEKWENSSLRKLLALSRQQMKLTRALTDDICDRADCEVELAEVERQLRNEEARLTERQLSREESNRQAQQNSSPADDEQRQTAGAATVDGGTRGVRSSPDGEATTTSQHAAINDSFLTGQFNLTDAQQLSLLAPTPESEASDTLLTLAKMQPLAAVGMRLVSQQELTELKSQLQSARDAATRPCDNCKSLESQLQESKDQLATAKQTIDAGHSVCESHCRYIEDLESNLHAVAADSSTQISALTSKLHDSVMFVESARQNFTREQQQLVQLLNFTTEQRENCQRRLEGVQAENDLLVGKHSRHAQQLQEEFISLPTTTEELQVQLLQCREQLICAKVGAERQSELLNSELELSRSQATANQHDSDITQQKLSDDVTQLQEQLVIQRSICSELEREKAELMLSGVPTSDTLSRQTIANLQRQLQQLHQHCSQLEQDNQQLSREMSLLRSATSDQYDWQYGGVTDTTRSHIPSRTQGWSTPKQQLLLDDNVCSSCHQPFTQSLVQVECQQCGQVYCNVCTSHCISRGPSQQLTNVCRQCHAMSSTSN